MLSTSNPIRIGLIWWHRFQNVIVWSDHLKSLSALCLRGANVQNLISCQTPYQTERMILDMAYRIANTKAAHSFRCVSLYKLANSE